RTLVGRSRLRGAYPAGRAGRRDCLDGAVPARLERLAPPSQDESFRRRGVSAHRGFRTGLQCGAGRRCRLRRLCFAKLPWGGRIVARQPTDFRRNTMTLDRFPKRVLLTLFVLGALALPVLPQSYYGGLTGTARDQNGGAIAGAKITLSNTGTNAQRSALTGTAGGVVLTRHNSANPRTVAG